MPTSFSIANALFTINCAKPSSIPFLKLQSPSSAPAVDGYFNIANGGLFKNNSTVSSPYLIAFFNILNCALSASKLILPSGISIHGISAPTLKFFLFGGFSPPPKL